MERTKRNIILGLETALDGGSVALLKDGKPIDSASGNGSLSKSEDILPIIETLLERNKIERSKIGRIAVSDGPGSLTGLRVGLAIAKGLGDAFSAQVSQMSVLEALTCVEQSDGRKISALYTERNGVFFREFLVNDGKRTALGEILQISSVTEFYKKFADLKDEDVSFVLTENLIRALIDQSNNIENFEKIRLFPVRISLAEAIGLAAASDNE